MSEYKNKEFRVIEDPENYFKNLGALHDARVERIFWLPEKKELLLFIDDLNSGFLDLPEYKGFAPAILMFNGVESVDFKFAKCETHLNIFEFKTLMSTSRLEVIIKFWPSGQCDLQCSSVGVKDLGEGQAAD